LLLYQVLAMLGHYLQFVPSSSWQKNTCRKDVSGLQLSATGKVHNHKAPVAYSSFVTFPLCSACFSREASKRLFLLARGLPNPFVSRMNKL
jgi:hypothetical protein